MAKNSQDKLLVIIPAFNECKSIVKTVKKVKDNKLDYIVIDDCSYDPTDLICKENKINYIRNETNLGLSKTMREGFKYALDHGYEYAVQFDGDGQHDINTVIEMQKLIETCDVVLSNRFASKENETSTTHKEFA